MESLGAYLKNKRETYGLTLDDIYARTKIRHHVIEQIENNNFSVMPAPYLRSFLRTYCDMVGIEPDEAQQLIARIGLPQKPVTAPPVNPAPAQQTEVQTQKPVKHTAPKAEHSVKPLLVRGFVYAGIFLVIVILAYEFVFKPDPNKKAQIPEKADSSLLTVVGNTVVGLIDESVTSDSLMLELRASDQVWLTLTADGKFSRQLVLNAQEKRIWSAKEYFTLSVSNAGALEISRNGQILPVLGEKGEFVRSIKITKDEFITSSSSYNKQITSENQQSTSQSQQNAIVPKPKPTVEQAVPVQKPVITPQKNTTNTQKQTVKEPVSTPKKENIVKTPPKTTNTTTTQTKQPTNTPPKQTEVTPKPNQTKQAVVKEKTSEPKKTDSKTDVKTSQKQQEKKTRQKRRGTLEIEEVPLRPIEQGLPTIKTQPKQIPP